MIYLNQHVAQLENRPITDKGHVTLMVTYPAVSSKWETDLQIACYLF